MWIGREKQKHLVIEMSFEGDIGAESWNMLGHIDMSPCLQFAHAGMSFGI